MCKFGIQVFFIVYLSIFVSSEWVEIPQFASKKSYLGVTPFTSYIYDKSAMFTSTTSAPYDSIVTPIFKTTKSIEVLKKSITKLPDSVMKNFLGTTAMPSTKRPSFRPNPRNATANYNKKNKTTQKTMRPKMATKKFTKNATKTSTSTTTEKPRYQPKVSKLILDEQEYEETVYDDYEEYEDDKDVQGDDESLEEGVDEYYDDTEYGDSYEEEVEKQKGANEGYTYAGFLPYLQNIQSTLIRNSHTTPQSKVSFLTDIKNRLLYAIQQKIASLWTSGTKSRTARSTRGDYQASWEKGDSGMSFPSNEGALLTLGFLTFAVFLIKCVLKLVSTIKHKDNYHGGYGYNNNVVYVLATTPGTITIGKRSISDTETADVMNRIDSFKYK